jgi:alpha-tubulin suppressor-like RCC1 family protein
VHSYRRLVLIVLAGLLVTACAAILGDFQGGGAPGDTGDGSSDAVTGGDGRGQSDGALALDGGDGGGGDAGAIDGASSEANGGDGGARDGASVEAASGDAGNSEGGEAGPPLPVLDVLGFALGSAHTCAVVRYTPSGDAAAAATTTYCWGANDHGQLGGGTTTPLPDAGGDASPAFVVPLTATTLAHVAASSTSNHTCAYDVTGQVWCWGANDLGQVNGAVTTSTLDVPTPVRLTDSNTGGRLIASQLAVGANHACSADTRADASAPIFCWGANDHCQAGHVDTTGACTFTPENVAPAPALTSAEPVFGLALGDNATIIVDQRFGTHPVLDFIGDSANGQCNGQSLADVPNLQSCGNWGQLYPIDVSMGNGHGCVVASDDGGVANQVDCWGDNSTLQVDPTLTGGGHVGGHPVFTAVPGVPASDVPVAVGAGNGDSCVVFSTPGRGNSLACQGANSHFQLASNTNLQAAGPVVVNDGAGRPIDVMSVGLGSAHVCALTRMAPHNLLCWGDNSYGQVGVPVTRSSMGTFDVLSPVAVAFPVQAH